MNMKKSQLAAVLLTLTFATPAFPCEKNKCDRKTPTEKDHQVIRGLLTKVDNKQVELTTPEGYTYIFKLDKKLDVSVVHLKEHAAKKEPVAVHFTDTGKSKTAFKITD